MDKLESMRLLVATVDEGSLSAAARKLGIPLATVSRKVSDLESHLRTKLLNRSNRRLTLTDAGQAYVSASKRILEEIHDAECLASGEYASPRGDLVVTAPSVFGRIHMVPTIVAFLEAYPDVDVRLILDDRVINLVEKNIDVALRISVLPESSLVATKIGDIRRVVCGSPAYFKEHGMPKHPSDLTQHACITFEEQFNSRSWNFGTSKSPFAVSIHSRLTTTTAAASIDAAKLGAGITRVLSYQVEDAVQRGELALALEEYEPPSVPVNLVYRGGGLIPLKLRVFIDFVAPRLRARLNQPNLHSGDVQHKHGDVSKSAAPARDTRTLAQCPITTSNRSGKDDHPDVGPMASETSDQLP